jgi:hypothetical protein
MEMNIKKKKILLCAIVALFVIFSFIKRNISIYAGDFSWDACSIDIQLKIDDKLIFNDSLYSHPYIPVILKEKLKYGFHKINVSSKKANVNQEKTVLLLPNQYIYIEFFSADTLCLEDRKRINEKLPSDSLFLTLDTMNVKGNEISRFRIDCSFSPFYIE